MRFLAGLSILGLVGCTQVSAYGEAAATMRRQQNDLQAQGALLQLCDLSLGSISRLDEEARNVVLSYCGLPIQPVFMLTTPEGDPRELVPALPMTKMMTPEGTWPKAKPNG